jgi:flagellar protein FlaI
MATDDADGPPTGRLEGSVDSGAGSGAGSVAVGEYTWADYLAEYGDPGDAEALYEDVDSIPGTDRWDDGSARPTADDWARVSADPTVDLGFHPTDVEAAVAAAGRTGREVRSRAHDRLDLDRIPVVKDLYTWDEYGRDEHGGGSFDRGEALGHDPDSFAETLGAAGAAAEEFREAVVEPRTVSVNEDLDEDEFFTTDHGTRTIVTRYDLEKAVPAEKKTHFREVERYWVNEPHSFVVVFHSTKENEKKYYVIEPHMNSVESRLQEFLTGKLRTAIKYADEGVVADRKSHRLTVIERETLRLLERYDLFTRGSGSSLVLESDLDGEDDRDEDDPDGADESTEGGGFVSELRRQLGLTDDPTETPAGGATGGRASTDGGTRTAANGATTGGNGAASEPGLLDRLLDSLGLGNDPAASSGGEALEGMSVRPEPAVVAENARTLNEYQVDKLLYYLKRDFIGYERIDGIKHDINVEDISCDGYNSPVFAYHTDYEQLITNVYHEEEELDDFVVKLAQRSGKGISKRQPQVDATLPDGSRAQLTLGKEVSDHGTNYTIRQFKDVPFTPVDLVNWKTFSLEEMAFLWLCIENHKSLIFAGGTASGKTTSLNAVSLFIPSKAKIVSIEDTREVELPQRNWIASVTRPSFSDDEKGDVDEFDLLEAALRQRPDYIVMGEIRGEEGRTLFQVMSTGHTTYTTFHADSVGEVLKRFTTDPINVSKTMFTALDLVSIQTSTRVEGNKVRRNKVLTEINHYDAENDEINVQDVYQWQAETDEFLKMGESNTLQEIMFDRGWTRDHLDRELFKRQVVLAYLIDRGLNTYTQVAATFQAFINDQETILTLVARDELERSLEDLREMESVLIDIEPEKEAMVPRPSPDDEIGSLAEELLAEAAEELFPDYQDREIEGLESALRDLAPESEIVADPGETPELDATVDAADDERPALAAGEDDPAGESPAAPDPEGGAAVDAAAGEVDDDASVAFDDAGASFDGDGDAEPAVDEGAVVDAEPGATGADFGEFEDVEDAEDAPAVGLDDDVAVDGTAAGGTTVTPDATDGAPPDAGDTVPGGVDAAADGDGGTDADHDGDGDGDGSDADVDADAEVEDSWGFGGFTTADPQEEQ